MYYATKICGCHAALQECIVYYKQFNKELNYTCTLIPSDTQSNAKVDNVRSFGHLVAN